MKINQNFKRQNDLTSGESYLGFEVSLFRTSSIGSPTDNDYLYRQQMQIEWSLEESFVHHMAWKEPIENENNREWGLMVDFESSNQSLSDYFVKSYTQQQLRNQAKDSTRRQTKSRNLNSRNKAKKKEQLHPCCNCKQSQCLKRYCPCFHNDTFCTNCNCKGCQNRNEKIDEVERARMHVFKNCHRKKEQPREKLLQNSVSYGCSCSKTQCLQGYCECFKRGQVCDEKCKCLNCKNTVQNYKFLDINPGSKTSITELNQFEEAQQQ